MSREMPSSYPVDLNPRRSGHSGSLLILNKFSELIIWTLTKPESKAAYIRNPRVLVPGTCEMKLLIKDARSIICMSNLRQAEPDADLDIASEITYCTSSHVPYLITTTLSRASSSSAAATIAPPSKRLETAQNFIANFNTLSGRKGILEHVAQLHAVMSSFPLTVKEYIESDSSNQVTVWASSRAMFRDEGKDDGVSEAEWAYGGEYVFLLWMDETGEKLIKSVEFLDS
ncbi:hypothetical protein BDDG_12507 [Blastomyces dermatitidis ATCC 18188]|uniref:Uncharacterized protein n=2 Tax=Ajellomyces dermatitidis TaxID=5039 RepID=A0A0J9ES54_AJEDA|nr:hypothetical protein BDDG_12507 [Blastomyces dermatitidis ATCC 18188]